MGLIDLKFFHFHFIPVSKWLPINYLCLNLVSDAIRIQKFKFQRGLMGKNNRNQLKNHKWNFMKFDSKNELKLKFLTFSMFKGSRISVFRRSFQKWSQILSKSKYFNWKTKKSNPKKLSFFKLLSTKKLSFFKLLDFVNVEQL